MSRPRLLVAAFAAFALFTPALAQQGASIDSSAARIRGHVEFLASDLLEGRETGTRGHEIAAAYVAAEFRKLGLEPAGPQGSWYVEVPFRRASHAAPPTVQLVRNGRATPLVVGSDFGLRPSVTERERAIDAGLVFVGHGISDSRVNIDEYAGLDVRGKIVVALEGTPGSLPSDVAAHLQSVKDDVAATKGAVGFIEIGTDQPGPGRVSAVQRRGRPLLDWVDQQGRAGSAAVRVDAALSQALAARLFEGAPRSLAQVQALAKRGPITGFALPASLRIRAISNWEDFTSPEVVARLPGSDPALRQDHVLLAGHLDHIGVKEDAAPGEDAINNGALDNAGGVATMLEAARLFAESRDRPRRSLLFVAHTGEEKGLLGAAYLAANPPIPAENMVALVNLDMPLLLYGFTDVIPFGAEHSTLGRAVAAAAQSMQVAVAPDPMPEQTLFIRSDHYPFVKRGVPSVFLMTGHGNGGKKAWDEFLGNRYHRPNDDLAQPIDWQAGARFAQLNYRIARELADAPHRPQWYSGSYFGQIFAPSQPKAAR